MYSDVFFPLHCIWFLFLPLKSMTKLVADTTPIYYLTVLQVKSPIQFLTGYSQCIGRLTFLSGGPGGDPFPGSFRMLRQNSVICGFRTHFLADYHLKIILNFWRLLHSLFHGHLLPSPNQPAMGVESFLYSDLSCLFFDPTPLATLLPSCPTFRDLCGYPDNPG